MRKSAFAITTFLVMFFTLPTLLAGQDNRDLQYFRSSDKSGINTFETTKDNDVTFEGLRVRIGGSNTLQFQAIDHENAGPFRTGTDAQGNPIMGEIFNIGPNFNLATSNLDIDVQLHNGLRMHLRTYLSSRHHSQPYVKGGYKWIALTS